MNLPESGRVIIIDDKFNEIETLIKVLSKYRVAVTYFTGRKEELPENPFSDVRIVFLDVQLEGVTLKEEKTVRSVVVGVISRIIDSKNGPFILAIWTKHPEVIEPIKKTLLEEGYQPIPFDIQKSDFFESDGKPKIEDTEMFDSLNKKLHETLKDLGIFNIFLLWENITHNSASSTVNSFSQLVKFDDSNTWNNEMLTIFYNLAKAWAGKTLDINKPVEIIKNALFTFKGIFEDDLEEEIYNIQPSSINKFGTENVNEEIIGKLNTSLLLDTTTRSEVYPGNIYEEEQDAEIIKDILNVNDNDPLVSIKNISKVVSLEVSPLCDFVQKKMRKSRLLKGVILPEKIPCGNGSTFNIWNKIKQKAAYIYTSPVFYYSNQLYKIVFDFRYFSSVPITEIQNKSPVFRLRKEILTDIQIKLASHISRTGVLYLE